MPQLANANEVIVAYEPIWAIGTGRNATGAMVAEIVGAIRDALERFWPADLAQRTPILYGGSVTPDNVDDLIEHGGIDGFLVGGASLDSKKFLALAEAMKRLPSGSLDTRCLSGKNSPPCPVSSFASENP